MNTLETRDHGGGVDAAMRKYGGSIADWIDLSTGINPVAYPVFDLDDRDWATLPDKNAADNLVQAARDFWEIPAKLSIVAAPGLSSIITRLPGIVTGNSFAIPWPTYNEYEAAFSAAGWNKVPEQADATIIVHPNNPDGRIWQPNEITNSLTIIDESFCDVSPDRTFVNQIQGENRLILKSFGKFWGLAGMRLGFAIGNEDLLSKIKDSLGPWPVSGPALSIGARALGDTGWATQTRARLASDTIRLDDLMTARGANLVGGTTLFRLYSVDNAAQRQAKLAASNIWTRIFPYSENWLRLGIPGPADWDRLEQAL